MESVIAQSIQLLLPYQNIRRIAFGILWNYHQNSTKVDSLQVLSLKKIMKMKMKKGNYKAKIFYRIVFKEPQDYEKFADRRPYRDFLERLSYWIWDNFTNYPKKRKLYSELRTDPHIMLSVLEQCLSKYKMFYIRVHIHRTVLKISTDFFDSIAEIPNGVEYDTHWADAFARLAFSKSIISVFLTIKGDDNTPLDFLSNHITSFTNSIKPTIPDEGWKEAVESRRRPIYIRAHLNFLTTERKFVQPFVVKKKYCSGDDYWGYLE